MDFGGSDGRGDLQNQLGEVASSSLDLLALMEVYFNERSSPAVNLLVQNPLKARLHEDKVARQGVRAPHCLVFGDAVRDSWPGVA